MKNYYVEDYKNGFNFFQNILQSKKKEARSNRVE